PPSPCGGRGAADRPRPAVPYPLSPVPSPGHTRAALHRRFRATSIVETAYPQPPCRNADCCPGRQLPALPGDSLMRHTTAAALLLLAGGLAFGPPAARAQDGFRSDDGRYASSRDDDYQ